MNNNKNIISYLILFIWISQKIMIRRKKNVKLILRINSKNNSFRWT
jgi:hypothetical protein